MKLNLLLADPGGVRSGYFNVDPTAGPADPAGRVNGYPHDLSTLVDKGECQEIVALDILDRYSSSSVDETLSHWVSLLAHGGTLTVGVIDLHEVSRAFLASNISLDDANILLHGEQDGPYRHRQATLTLSRLSEVLESKGLKVLRRRITNFKGVLTCQRP